MDIQEYITKSIEYLETMEKCWTYEMINMLKTISKELKSWNKVDLNEEDKALNYLKEHKVKWAHLYKGDKLMAKAKEMWFTK